MRPLLWLLPLALPLLGCDSGDGTIAAGAVAGGVGPTGADLKGPTGTQLEGLLVHIPPGALDRFVQVSLAPGTPIELSGTESAGTPVRVLASPDPGLLLLPITITMPARMRAGFTDQALLAAQRVRLAGPDTTDAIVRLAVAADGGEIDARRATFTFPMQRLCDFEIRRAARHVDDAATLVELGIAAFQPLTPQATRQAGARFAQALLADPLSGEAMVFEAAARLLTLLLDDTDTSADIDSLGEALRRVGVDLGGTTLLERLLTLDTSGISVRLPVDAPNVTQLLAFAERVLRPQLADILEQLGRVPDGFTARLTLPARFAPVPRTVDRGDVASFRATVALLLGVIDMLRGLDLDLDLAQLASGAGQAWSFDDVLARFPGLFALRRDTFPEAGRSIAEALALADEAYSSILREGSDQSDHIVRIPAGWSAARREITAAQLHDLLAALVGRGTQVLRQDGIPGSFLVDLKPLFRSLVISPRALLPDFVRWVPTGALPDPTFAGTLPLMTRAEATLRAGLANRVTPPDATITVDGDPADWPAAAEALIPRDSAGDVAGSAGFATVDGTGLWLARTATDLYARIDVTGGPIAPAPEVVTHYTLVLRELRPRGLGPKVELDLLLGTPPSCRLLVDGQVRTTASVNGAFQHGTVELRVALSDLIAPFLTPGQPWLACFTTRARETAQNLDASDDSRVVVVQ